MRKISIREIGWETQKEEKRNDDECEVYWKAHEMVNAWCLMSKFDEILAKRQSLCTHNIYWNFSIRVDTHEVYYITITIIRVETSSLFGSPLSVDEWRKRTTTTTNKNHSWPQLRQSKHETNFRYSTMWIYFSTKRRSSTRKPTISNVKIYHCSCARYSGSHACLPFHCDLIHVIFLLYESPFGTNNNANRWRADQVNADCKFNGFFFFSSSVSSSSIFWLFRSKSEKDSELS